MSTSAVLSTFEYVVIHHSDTEDTGSVSWLAIGAYHHQEFGINTQGYHWGVEEVEDGAHRVGYMTMRGAPMTGPGVHVALFNHKAVGVCLVGNFDLVAPPAGALIEGAKIARWCLQLIGRDGQWDRVVGHRDVGLMQGHDWRKGEFKSCPGRLFDMEDFRSRVAQA